ncbi:phage baseplate assembly protein V [Burkholderia stabilis]
MRSEGAIFTDDGNYVGGRTSSSRNERNTKATTWIRTAMPEAGSTRGSYLPLCKDDQVLPGFANGDCDRQYCLRVR